MIDAEDLAKYVEAGDDPSEDVLEILEKLEVSAVGILSDRTGRYWGERQESHTYYLDGLGGTNLMIPDGNVEVASVEVRSGPSAPHETVASSGYVTLSTNFYTDVMRVDGGAWPAGAASVRVVAARGFDDAEEVPAMIRQAVLDYVNFMYRPGRQAVLTGKAAELSQIPNFQAAIDAYTVPMYG